jgi:pantoate--beta-alanine ligase
MEIIRTISWMKQVAQQARAENHLIGFVPTMGALHEGHLSLVRRAKAECSKVFASIFVNPTQFGPGEDLSRYPRRFDSDIEKLLAAGVDALFAPDPGEMYPPGFSTFVTVEGLSERLEGKSRPGHFRGVTTVVLKLLEVLRPHFAFFGRKDAQQARIVERMTSDLNLDVELRLCPIAREPDGLALSSRNAYLNADERQAATALYRALQAACREIAADIRDAQTLERTVYEVLRRERLARIDYAEVVDAESFEPVARIGSRPAYILLAVSIGNTRLIDNLLIESSPESGDLTWSL